MTQLTNAQTELVKYLNSQLLQTQKEMDDDVKRVSNWLKEEKSDDMKAIIDYEINKIISHYELLKFRYEWLDKQITEL